MKICTIQDCSKPHYAFGLCAAHYTRNRRHGSPCGGGTVRGEPMNFLLSLIGTRSHECIKWPYARARGYGMVSVDGRMRVASNYLCELIQGPPPSVGHECAHSCGRGNQGCVNPNHLRWATRGENHADKHTHGTHNKGERNWNCKLTENEARHIKQNPSNLTGASLAELFGVSRSAVSAIQVGKNWSWL